MPAAGGKIAIIGGGVWGAAFGRAVCDKQHEVCFWDRVTDVARHAATNAGGQWQPHLTDAVQSCDVIVVAVSSNGFIDILKQLAPSQQPLLWLTKGFVAKDRLLCEIAAELLPSDSCFGALSGPTFAAEVAQQLPTAMAVAVNHPAQLPVLQTLLHRKMLRIYPVTDLVGVCISGALKNIIAIAAGISDGMQLGANARAAIITRGLAEITAFNHALGGQRDTPGGIAGIGDLVLTCTSDLSRNRQLGLCLGRGQTPPAATVEGVAAAAAAHRRAQRLNICAPLIAAVHGVLHENLSPAVAADRLLSRPPPPCVL